MRPVVEDYPSLECHLALKQSLGVTAGAQAACIFYLCIRFGTVSSRNVLDDLSAGLKLEPEHPFPGRRIVTLHAGDLLVLGGLPCVVVRRHDVARITEARTC